MIVDPDLAERALEPDTPGWQFAFTSGVLGWVLDAFDFFVLVFLFDELAAKFHVSKEAIIVSLTLTLAMRPIGALLFGALADRFGRRKPLILCVIYFSLVTVLSGFAPNYLFFLAMRALYGIGMGGYWGIGASYAMESAPRRYRGILSGCMQSGYSTGYLIAAIGMQTIAPRFGWQSMFFIGSAVAVVIVLITLKAPESESWKLHQNPAFGTMFSTLWSYRRIFLYMLLLMTIITCFSHGTQDLYPDFLKSLPFAAHSTVLGMKSVFGIPVIYNIGAILGAILFGWLSERIGRRYAVIAACAVSLCAMPFWAFGTTLTALVVGAYFMQTGVQGAFGVIPAHLNELSPAAIRGLFPGFVYQLGVLLSAGTPTIEKFLQHHFGYRWALASFELCVILALVLTMFFGPENRGRDFRTEDATSHP